jgi:hypothetical protein
MNFTTGGQSMSQVESFHQAKAKTSRLNWANKYIPALRAMETKRLWETPKDYIVDVLWKVDGWPVGVFLNDLRRGHTEIPRVHREELQSFGFDEKKSIHESRYEHDYIPAFRASLYGKEKRLWSVPKNEVENKISIGVILMHLRAKNTFLPEMYVQVMEELGYNEGRGIYELRWELVYMPEFRKMKCCLSKVSRLHKVSKINVGEILRCIRKGHSTVPKKYVVEMEGLGCIIPSVEKPCRKRKM